MEKKILGAIDGKEICLYTLQNSFGASVSVTNYGCAICSLIVPDKTGKPTDVVLGFDTPEAYVHQKYYIGTVIGRCANRIKNASFDLNGRLFRLSANEGPHHLHGGFAGFHDVVWEAESHAEDRVIFHYFSPDKEEGYPGSLDARVSYELTADSTVHIQYHAHSGEDTPVNLTNHSYFNLGGHGSGSVENHTVMVNAAAFLEIDGECLPTGVIKSVKGTPFDLRCKTRLGDRLACCDPQMLIGSGFNHTFILSKTGKKQSLAAVLANETTGIQMEVLTTEPSLQLYTGNYLHGDIKGKGGAPYGRFAGVCLETQGFPNAVQNAHFPSVILKKDGIYLSKTSLQFKTLS